MSTPRRRAALSAASARRRGLRRRAAGSCRRRVTSLAGFLGGARRTGVESAAAPSSSRTRTPRRRTPRPCERLGGGEVRGEDGERAPGRREPEPAVERAAEQLEVVGDDDEAADGDEGEEPQRSLDRDGDADRARRPRSTMRRGWRASACGIRVCSGRPCSSSSACAPTPIARKNASVVQPSSAQSIRGASAAPSATYERCQSVYGGWRSVT